MRSYETRKQNTKAQEVVEEEDEAQRAWAESSWGHLGLGDVRPGGACPIKAELGEPNLPAALSRFVHAQSLGTGTGGGISSRVLAGFTQL